MEDLSIPTIPESDLNDITIADVDELRAVKTDGTSVNLPIENLTVNGAKVPISVAGVTATNAQAAIAELKANEDTLGTTKVATTTQVIAGSGLTGGGTLASDRTLNVAATDDSIVVAADSIKVNTVDALTSDSATRPLSAKQGKALDDVDKANYSKSVEMIAHNATAPSPVIPTGTTKTYEFSSGGVCTWLANQFVEKGDKATVAFTAPSTFVRTYQDVVSRKVDDSQIKQVAGASETDVMSQKAVTDLLNKRYEFIGQASIGDTVRAPTIGGKFVYVASDAGTYTNHGGIIVNDDEMCFLYCVNTGGVITWSKSIICRLGDTIIAAHNASAEWKAVATIVVDNEFNGIPSINTYISQKAKNGDTIILSEGDFTTQAVDGFRDGINLNKSITLSGQGVTTRIARQSTALDVVVSKDGVSAKLENVNIAHGAGIAAKTDIAKYDSTIHLRDIFINGVVADVDTLNYINKINKPTLAHPSSEWRIYATKIVDAANNLKTIKEYCYNTTYVPASDDIDDRTILLLPSTYVGANGLYFNKNIVCRLIGLKGYENETIIKRITTNTSYPNDIYIDNVSTSNITDTEIRIENISFYDMLSYSYCRNFHMVNCCRKDVKLDDYNGENIIEVGKNKICERLSIALQIAKNLAETNNRYTIKVYGEVFDNTICDADVANVDIEGYNGATIIREGWSEGADRNTPLWHLLRTGDNWNGSISNITFKLAGVMKGYNFAALEIKSGQARLFNVKAINLSMAGKLAKDGENNIYVRFDDQHRMVRCYANAGSSTGYTAQIYSRIFGTPTDTYECSASDAAAPHDYPLFIRKPDEELEPLSWDDLSGGRRYGLYFKCPTECDVVAVSCEGYGSPWGMHNTRGIYIDYGSPKLLNCIGVSGGIGHRLHGIVSHRDSTAEIVGCIGYASPFAWLTPQTEAYMPHYNIAASVGIKAQMMSSSKFIGCVGYGNEMPMGHGIYADNMTKAFFNNCSGFTRGGINSAGFSIAEYATTNINGGYFGRDEHTHSEDFIPNNGNGMDFYPLKRCTRVDTTEDDVIYANHWDTTVNNADLAYRVIRLFISRYNLQGTIYAGKICKFYDVDESGNKTLITSSVLENENGNYQFIDLAAPYTIEIGHHIYVVIEDSNSVEVTVSSGTKTIAVSICVDILNNGQSGMYINTYWSHDGEVNINNPLTHLPYPIIISNVIIDSVRIGEKADILQKYNIIGATINGGITKDTVSENPIRVYNSVQIDGASINMF
jgi:hypothetical protein